MGTFYKQNEYVEYLRDSILLFLGEGNFSFSASLSSILTSKFSSCNCKIIATDYIPELESELKRRSTSDNEDDNQKKASFKTTLLKQNLSILKSQGHNTFLDVDARKLHEHKDILHLLSSWTMREGINGRCCSKIILIVFNFPHVKSRKMKIGLNRELLRDFFISCDKLLHILNEEKVNIIPIVSLCAGQSGIPHVETESARRSWGDSWQINDMAAHGNFVCSSIKKFGKDWELSSMISSENLDQAYQSSYFRLQTGVSFTTENALTLTYQHRSHVDTTTTDRLTSILKFKSQSDNISKENEVIESFVGVCGPIFEEKVISNINDLGNLPYHHVVYCQTDVAKISHYLKSNKGGGEQDGEISVECDGVNVQVKTTGGKNGVIGEALTKTADDNHPNMALYLDQLLEFKYKTDYRLLLSDTFCCEGAPSLYPHTHQFHISFWVEKDSSRFSKDLFLETLLSVYGLMLKSVQFVEEYEDKQKGRKSLCWKIQVQSLDYPLSRQTAHQIYLKLRNELSKRLNVEVR